MKYCAYCGEQIEDGAAVCVHCGKAAQKPVEKADEAKATKYCAYCGKQIVRDAVMCVHCGKAVKRLDEEEAAKKKKLDEETEAAIVAINCATIMMM